MYIRWNGDGAVIVVIQFLLCGVFPCTTYTSFMHTSSQVEVILVALMGFLVGAPIMWILGRRLNEYGAEHSVYGLPVEDWGYVPVLSLLWLYFMARLSADRILGSTSAALIGIVGVGAVVAFAYFVARRRYS
jgi:hypothetical protein